MSINGDVLIHVLAADERIIEHVGHTQQIDEITRHISHDICEEILNHWQYATANNHHHKDSRCLSGIFTETLCCEVKDGSPHH